MSDEAADALYWKQIEWLTGWRLFGFTYRHVASFEADGMTLNLTGPQRDTLVRLVRLASGDADVKDGLRPVLLLDDYKVSEFGEVLCASCGHGHRDGSWSDRDPDDGTCWSAGSLVCGCPKFITPAVQKIVQKRYRAALTPEVPDVRKPELPPSDPHLLGKR